MNKLYGEPETRRLKNRERLSDEMYRAPQIFAEGGEWPGDWQGRALLALACHYKMAPTQEERDSVYLQANEILRQLPEYTNIGGYFGDIFDENNVNEQQLSGNSWFLRGLCMWYEITEDKELFARLERITQSLLLRLIPAYKRYPAGKREDGAVDGHLQKETVNGWRLSSDVGCAFILLDGITDVYATTKDVRLAEVIRVMIGEFCKINYVKSQCQTHATLTAARGIIRFYRVSGETQYLAATREIFRRYCEEGMTVNFANFNWFGKPFWTEPCAVVDSLLLAVQLFRETGGYSYAQLANRIYTNAFRRAQRPNGGAGCDSCLCEYTKELKVLMYEAFFCCTMRYAEGLLCVYENCIFEKGGQKVLHFHVQCSDEKTSVRITENDHKKLFIVEGSGEKVRIYIPRYIESDKENGETFVSVTSGKELMLEEQLHTEKLAGTEVVMCGDAVVLKDENGIVGDWQNCLFMTAEEVGKKVWVI